MPELSKGVQKNGLLPGHEPTMDPSKAGENWATFEISEGGTPKHYVLPTKKSDNNKANDKTGFMGDAVERFRTSQLNGSPQHYGAFDSDETGSTFMKNNKKSKLKTMYPTNRDQ